MELWGPIVSPEFSEFSYGFALTRELIAVWENDLLAAPIFPSLIEEGRAGGGYDVNLKFPGFPLFLQFKRADCMVRRSAIESSPPHNFTPPFFRMYITERWRSAQHEMLVALDDGGNQVFYAAPVFHTLEELNRYYLAAQVSQRSFYIAPSRIGRLDNDWHHVTFDDRRCRVFSEPIEISGVPGNQLPSVLRTRLDQDHRPLGGGPIDETVARVEGILREHAAAPDIFTTGVEVREPAFRPLRYLADMALRYFSAQLFIIQDARERPRS